MGRLLYALPASPSLGTKITSAIFHTRANVLNLKELFIRDVTICKVAGKLSLSILAGILSKPGAVLEGKLPRSSLIQAEIQTVRSEITRCPRTMGAVDFLIIIIIIKVNYNYHKKNFPKSLEAKTF